MSFETLKNKYMALSRDAIMVRQVPSVSCMPRIIYINQSFTDLFGFNFDDVASHTSFRLLNSSSLKDSVEGGDFTSPPADQHTEITQKNGTRIWVNTSDIIVENEDGEGHLVCTTFRISSKPDQTGCTAMAATTMPEPPALSQDRLLAALNAYPDPIVIYGPDLRLVSWNHGYSLSVTDTPTDLEAGMHLEEVLYLAVKNGRYPDAIGHEKAWVDAILTPETLGKSYQDVELDGDIHHRLLRSRSTNGDYVVVRLNSTEFVRQKRQAEAVQSRLIAALNAYPSPFVIYDSDDCLVVWNDAYRRSMTDDPDGLRPGIHRMEVARVAIKAGKIVNARGHEDEWLSDKHQKEDMAKTVQDIELDGDIHHRLLRSRVENGDLVIVRLDTTELVRQRRAVEQYAHKLEQANRETTYAAHHDDLTGLGNRRLLKIKLEDLAQRRTEGGGEIAALHIDLDRFKKINDTMGHSAGDQVLLDTSKRIQSHVDPDDFVARIGGDEFIVLLYAHQNSPRPIQLANTLLSELSRPIPYQGKECRIGASIGVATTPLVAVDQLLITSDIALYKAKHRGRGQIGVYDSVDRLKGQRNKAMADDIMRGMAENEFVPFYLPQTDARTGQLVAIEILARWLHPEKGVLETTAFLPVVEHLNTAADLDRMIFEKAMQECKHAFGSMKTPPALSFNVSTKRIMDDDLLSIREHVLSYAGQISFEFLESVLFEEEDPQLLGRLKRLRDIGIAIEVDDFGSGRASVVALQRISPDRLKIEPGLVAQVTKSEGVVRLLRSIVQIGQSLQMGVTAEAVETLEQARILTDLGCDRLQGHYFAPPMRLPELLRYMSE